MTDATLQPALDTLPHREPFRFVSRVNHLAAGESGEGVWAITGNEDFFRGHFPGNPIVPGVLLGEALAQLCGLVGLHGTGFTSGRLVHVDIRFDAAVTPPAEVLLRSRLIRSMGALRQFEVEAFVGDERAARGTLALAGVEAR